MTELSSRQRKILERHAQGLSALVIIGGAGLTEAQATQTSRCLADHELVKVKFNEFKEERRELSEELAKATDSVLVRLIGNTAVLYRAAEEPGKRRFEAELARA